MLTSDGLRNRGYETRPGRPIRAAAALGATFALWLGACAGCGSGGARSACLELAADPSLNLYNGQPHVTVVYLYPLASRLGFEQMPVRELLAGTPPPGLVGSRLQVTIAPGERRDVAESLPAEASQLGLVADFYRAPGEPEGYRKAIVEARCGFRKPTLLLSRSDLLVQ